MEATVIGELRAGSDEVRRRVREVRTWALAQGHPVDADALTVVLLAKDDLIGGSPDRWTVEMVERLLWVDLVTWCAVQELPLPGGVAETMWRYLAFLHDTGRLADGSSRLTALQRPLCDYAGLGPGGVRAPTKPRTSRSAKRPAVRALDPLASVIALHPAGRR